MGLCHPSFTLLSIIRVGSFKFSLLKNLFYLNPSSAFATINISGARSLIDQPRQIGLWNTAAMYRIRNKMVMLGSYAAHHGSFIAPWSQWIGSGIGSHCYYPAAITVQVTVGRIKKDFLELSLRAQLTQPLTTKIVFPGEIFAVFDYKSIDWRSERRCNCPAHQILTRRQNSQVISGRHK